MRCLRTLNFNYLLCPLASFGITFVLCKRHSFGLGRFGQGVGAQATKRAPRPEGGQRCSAPRRGTSQGLQVVVVTLEVGCSWWTWALGFGLGAGCCGTVSTLQTRWREGRAPRPCSWAWQLAAGTACSLAVAAKEAQCRMQVPRNPNLEVYYSF